MQQLSSIQSHATPNTPTLMQPDRKVHPSPEASSDISLNPLLSSKSRIIPFQDAIHSNALATPINSSNLERVGSADADVGHKISVMLAATSSLKPQSSPPAPQLCGKISQTPGIGNYDSPIARLVLTKSKSRKVGKAIFTPLHNASKVHDLERDIVPHQLATIELRLNEGSNLNKAKVRKIVGGSIRRKPVHGHCPAKNLKSGRDPGSDTNGGDSNGHARKRIHLYDFTDPFEEEFDFEDDLSDGFLSEGPACSSTPKMSTSLMPPRGTSTPNHASRDTQDAPAVKNTDVFAFSKTQQHLPTSSSVTRVARVKKHPSPSKKALEDLEAAFAVYTRLKPLVGSDDTDELAKDGRVSLKELNQNLRPSQTKLSAADRSRSQHSRTRRSFPCQSDAEFYLDTDELCL